MVLRKANIGHVMNKLSNTQENLLELLCPGPSIEYSAHKVEVFLREKYPIVPTSASEL